MCAPAAADEDDASINTQVLEKWKRLCRQSLMSLHPLVNIYLILTGIFHSPCFDFEIPIKMIKSALEHNGRGIKF